MSTTPTDQKKKRKTNKNQAKKKKKHRQCRSVKITTPSRNFPENTYSNVVNRDSFLGIALEHALQEVLACSRPLGWEFDSDVLKEDEERKVERAGEGEGGDMTANVHARRIVSVIQVRTTMTSDNKA